ncbi:MAG: aldo/keto reductase [Gammaproteobacteria bacterium]|nr:aldo/keto reductase [Gammaproteobacteria bacterium]
MRNSTTNITRREAIKLCAGVGAGLLLLGTRCLHAGIPPSGQRAADLFSKTIPSSGEQIPVIGIGTARRYNVGTSAEERAPLREVLQHFVDLGGKMIDTAPSYGTAETVVGDLVADLGIRDQVFYATKVGAGGQGREAGIAEIEQSFRRLRTDHIELIQVHNLAGVNEMLPVLRDLKESGRIKYLGVTTTSPNQYEQLEQIMRNEPLDFIEVDYAIDNREVEARILPLAQDEGIAVLAALPFGRGRVFEAFGDQPIPQWAAEIGIESWAQFALKYVVSGHRPVA